MSTGPTQSALGPAGYALSAADLDQLGAMLVVSTDHRADLLADYLHQHGAEALVNLAAQALGMANSVVANTKAMAEQILVHRANWPADRAARINMPTMLGAITGAKAAALAPKAKTCAGCAYRLGSIANQCADTQLIAEEQLALEERAGFVCHETLHGREKPKPKPCRGHLAALKVTAS